MKWRSSVGPHRADGDSARFGLLAASWLMWLFIGAWAITPASVLPTVMDAFEVREAAAAYVITAPQLAATVTGIPIGMYLDRIDQRRAVFVATALLCLVGIGNTVAAANGNYWGLIGTRVIGGLGIVTLWTAQTAIITRAFPTDRKATAVGLFVTGYPAGYAFGQFSGPVIAGALDWTVTFGIYTGFGFAFAMAFWVFGRGIPAAEGSGDVPNLHELGNVLTNRAVWGVALLSLLSYMLYMIFNSWMPTYISRTFDMSLARGGFYTALFPAIGILARPSGGLLTERVFGGRSRPVIGLSFVVAGLTAASMAFGGTLVTLVAGLVAAGFFIQLQFGIIYTLVQAYVPVTVGGTAVGVVSAVGWLGFFAGPPLVGVLIEDQGSFGVVFAAAVALAVAGTVTVAAISEPDRG